MIIKRLFPPAACAHPCHLAPLPLGPAPQLGPPPSHRPPWRAPHQGRARGGPRPQGTARTGAGTGCRARLEGTDSNAMRAVKEAMRA